MSALIQNYNRTEIAIVKGEGMYAIADTGERYLDFAAGIAVNALGHCHPRLVKALQDQAETLWHTSNLFQSPLQERLASRLCEISFADCAMFVNSGGEAFEAAAKLARRYHYLNGASEKVRIITFEGAFHGRSLAAIAAAQNPAYTEGFSPLMDGFDNVPFGDLAAVKKAITPETAAIMLEPIQGEGGIRAFTPEMLKTLRVLCDDHNLLLILDEVQCGIARTGKMFAYQWAGIEPDIMMIAKGMGGGFPVGALLAKNHVGAAFTPSSHGTTFGGNPLAMAVGNAVMDVITEPRFLQHVTDMGNHLAQELSGLVDRHPDIFSDVRGQGLMLGLGVKLPPRDVVAKLRAVKLLTVPASNNAVRLLPPLIVEREHISEAIEKIDSAFGCDQLS